MEFLLSLLIPATTALYAYPLLRRRAEIVNLPLSLQLSFSLACGSSLLIILLSIWGMVVPIGFQYFSITLFVVMLILSGIAVWQLAHQRVRFSGVKRDLTLYFIVIYLLIYLLLFLLRPIVDPDIVDTYLPFARSILLADSVPERNYYDQSAFIIPPVGGPALFAYTYAISGSIQSEAFRFLNVPSFFGFIVLSYFLIRRYTSHSWGVWGVLLILSTPLLEDLVFMGGLYPDFIFSFLSLLSFWLVDQIAQDKKTKHILLYSILGLSAATMLLLKYQGMFMWLLIVFLLGALHLKGKWKLLMIPLVYLPFLLQIIAGGNYFGAYDPLTWVLFLILLGGSTYVGLWWSGDTLRKPARGLVFCILCASLGTSFIVRNYLLYGGLLDTSVDIAWIEQIRRGMNISLERGSYLRVWAYFLEPTLLLFFLVPKIVGLWKATTQKKFYLPVFIVLMYYATWVLFMGSTTVRWLLPLLPYVALFILLGLEALIKNQRIIERIIWGSVVFSILCSKFLFWNAAALFIGTSTLRAIPIVADSVSIIGNTQAGVTEAIWHTVLQLTYILTSRTQISFQDIWLLLAFGVLPFAILLLILKHFSSIKLYVTFILFVLLTSYGYIFFAVSGGNLFRFAGREQNMLFDYWGQSTYLVPYLRQHATSADKVVFFSEPTGLSYYTNVKAYNLEYGYGLYLFHPVFDESDLTAIYRYYKENRIRFVAIRRYGTSIERFERLKQQTKIFDLLDQNIYARPILQPENNNYWYLYEII